MILFPTPALAPGPRLLPERHRRPGPYGNGWVASRLLYLLPQNSGATVLAVTPAANVRSFNLSGGAWRKRCRSPVIRDGQHLLTVSRSVGADPPERSEVGNWPSLQQGFVLY